MNAYTYICTDGHVDVAPSLGTYSACQALLPVMYAGAVRGAVPCGCPVCRVPFDAELEAAYRLGGPEAVRELMSARVAPADVDTSTAAALGA